MKKLLVLALIALAGASYLFDQRVDLMGYDLPERKPIERKTALDFVNDVNRLSTPNGKFATSREPTVITTATTGSTWTASSSAANVFCTTTPAGVTAVSVARPL